MMQTVSVLWLGLVAFCVAHPALIAFLAPLTWPVLTGIASFADTWIEKKSPMLAELLAHTGLNAKGALRLLWGAASKKIPLPPLSVILMALLLTGCASTLRSGVIASVNAAADLGTGAEKVIADLDRTEQQACVDENVTPELRHECAAQVRARFHTAWNVYREYVLAWAASAATVRAYDAATAAARAPDPADLLKAATSLADAATKLRAAFEGLKALVAPAGSVNAAKIGGMS